MLVNVLLQAAPGAGSAVSQLVLIGAIFVIFYFFMIRPQQRKAKEAKNFINEIKKGDDIITIGGLHGKIYSLEDKILYLDVATGVRLKLNRSAISVEETKKLHAPAPVKKENA